MAKEVEEAMQSVSQRLNLKIVEFTVAPQVNPQDHALPYHEWFVEFDSDKFSKTEIEAQLDDAMRQQNIYYDDLIQGKILQPLKVTVLQKMLSDRI